MRISDWSSDVCSSDLRPADIYREHARLSTYRNNGRRLFDIGRHGAISNPDYDALEPFCWGAPPFADGHFPTGDGRARLVPVRSEERRVRKGWVSTCRSRWSPYQ